ncbi:palmitoyltransferase app isoform X1 [Toxorhynchites rutilus septentrionalis]|uniref:palmitoyltransferase app isoform X1 n=1 Tax=Toxorhynchites rutilus septentrionalis TaxID=329112 RepID=UPI00247ACD35|nr:palmitoyltransferase app isoform X1 [Toxorhynchites rutilus septentrionalis]
MAPSQKVTKKWEIFAGRNKFYCDGYLMTAPNSGVFYFTVVLITGTSGLFFAYDCPFLADRITPAIPIIGGILFVFTMSSLFRTSFSDPGIIPRASQDEAAYIEKQIEVPNSLNSPTYRPPPRTKEVFVKGQTVKLKYCFTCKIFRPPRASHCSLCDNCVDRFDHHCPWVGNCVGKRNYRFFYMFIVSLAFLAVFIFSCTTTHIVLLFKDEDQFFDIVKKTPFSVIIAVVCFCSVWSVIGLAGFHTYLTTSDQTTNEDIKGSFTSKAGQQAINPYSQGNICLNCFHILCGPITPSLIDRRGIVTDEYRTQMQSSDKYNTAPVPPLVVMQPGIDTLNKSYSLENDTQNTNIGVFRQRSYDNLQNEKSNSIAHLVENEVPLSTTGNISAIEDTTVTTVVMDEDTMMGGMDAACGLSKMTHQSESYSNLFRESASGKFAKLANSPADSEQIQNADEIINANELLMVSSVSGHENVYSNVPSGSGTIGNGVVGSPKRSSLSTIVTHSGEVVGGKSIDPNLHVYSNIGTSGVNVAGLRHTTSSGCGKFQPLPIGSNISTNFNAPDNLSMLNSSFIINDLDLDDPVISSAFTTKSLIPTTSKLTDSGAAVIVSSATNHLPLAPHKNTQLITAIEMKNVIKTLDPSVIIQSTGGNNTNSNTTSTTTTLTTASNHSTSNNSSSCCNNNNINSTNSNNAFITNPSRLRLLHESTMIDTALDLDSLDGSIGNNSQSCLVKTAIV